MCFSFETSVLAGLTIWSQKPLLFGGAWLIAALTITIMIMLLRRLGAERNKRLSLEAVFDKALVAICIIDGRSEKCIKTNDHARKSLDMASSGDPYSILDAMPSVELQRMKETIASAGSFFHREMTLRSKKGREFYAVMSFSPTGSKQGNLFDLVFVDIAEQKRHYDEMIMAKTRLESLIQASPDGIMVVTLDGKISFASEACLRFAGAPAGKFPLGRPCTEILPDKLGYDLMDRIHSISSGNAEAWPPQKITRPDGSIIWIEAKGVLVSDPGSEYRAVMLVVRDISRRMAAEQKLEERAAELQEAYACITKLQNQVLSICAWTKQVCVDGKWVSVDQYLSKNLGLKLSHGISDEGLEILRGKSGDDTSYVSKDEGLEGGKVPPPPPSKPNAP
jgi:PAS domain S-box-containing protein